MIKTIIENEFEKKAKGLKGIINNITMIINNVTDIISLLKDWHKGDYKVTPVRSIIAMIIGGLYLLSPIDFIPEFIPILGYVDDAFILSFAIKQFTSDLIPYREWKSEQ